MNYFRGLVLLGMFCFVCSSFVNGQNAKIDNVVGALWKLTLSPSGELKEFQLRATKNKKIFIGGDEIGSWKIIGNDKVTIEFTKRPLLKGTMELNKTRNKPPTYMGKLKRSDGTEVPVKIVMIED